jgi:hypothetical protein
MDLEDGRLRSPENEWISLLDITVPPIRAKDSVDMTQALQIALNALPYKHIKVTLALYISPAALVVVPDDCDISQMQLIQSHDVLIQVAPGYIHDETSEVLLVTNADTKVNQFEAIRHFVEEKLFLKMNVWNVSLYGRLFTEDASKADESENILSLYRGKAIIFLGNTFAFHGADLSSLQLCDSTSLFEAGATGTSCLFLGSIRDQDMFKNLLLPAPESMSRVLSKLSVTSHFESLDQLRRALVEESQTSGSYYELSVPRRRYLSRSYNMTSTAKSTIRTLRNDFPQDRFRVCPIPFRSETRTEIDGRLLVYRGLTQSSAITATEAALFTERPQQSSLHLPGAKGAQSTITTDQRPLKLDPVDQYTIASALTLLQRIDLLWSTGDSVEAPTPEDVLNFVVLSTQQALHAEIHSFLSHSGWPNSIRLDAASLSRHLPGTAAILEHSYARDPEKSIPPEIERLMLSTLASSRPQTKRQIAKTIAFPFGHRCSHLSYTLKSHYSTLLISKGYSRRDLSEFYAEVAKLYSKFNGKMRCTRDVLVEGVSRTTGKSTHHLTNGRVGLGDVVPKSRMWTVEEWDGRHRAMEQHNKQLSHRMQRAWDERYRLVLGDKMS